MNIPAGVNPLQLFFAVLFGAVIAAAAGACSLISNDEPPCFPPSYSLSPTSAQPGEAVTVSAPASDCNPRYGANARIQVNVTDENGVTVISTTAPMSDAGEFTYTFTVPLETAVGEAEVSAMPHNIDWCDDTGRNNRADGAVRLELASCVMPVETLTVTMLSGPF